MRRFNIFSGQGYSIKLKTQIIASTIIISSIIMAAGFFAIYLSVLDIVKKQNELSTLKLFGKAEDNIESVMDEVDKIFRLIIIEDDYTKVINNDFESEIDRVTSSVNLLKKIDAIITNYEYIDSIFSYGENGFVLSDTGNRTEFFFDKAKENWFYSSSLYRTINSSVPPIVWTGLYTGADFAVSGSNTGKINKLITCARKLRIGTGKEMGATFVVNIKERYFNSIFVSHDEEFNNMYLLDKEGTIISHSDETKIGEKYSFLKEISIDDKSGSFAVNQNNNPYQIVYYQLNFEEWVLVNEIPYNVFFRDVHKIRMITAFVFLGSLFAIFLTLMYWIYRLTRPLRDLTQAMEKMGDGTLGVIMKDLPKNELGTLGDQFNKMSTNILQLVNKNKFIEKEKRELEIEALQMQVNPHFLYNTLNIIKWMAVVANNHNIEDSIITLGNIIRPIFKNPSPMWTINEEFEHVKNYLKIINIRFGENINTNFEIKEKLENHYALKFMLQPIIENSFIHGIKDFNQKLNITITASLHEKDVLIVVSDDGIGMSAQKLQEIEMSLNQSMLTIQGTKKIGVSNVNRRIKLNFGEKYGLNIISSHTEGTKVIMKIPKISSL